MALPMVMKKLENEIKCLVLQLQRKKFIFKKQTRKEEKFLMKRKPKQILAIAAIVSLEIGTMGESTSMRKL